MICKARHYTLELNRIQVIQDLFIKNQCAVHNMYFFSNLEIREIDKPKPCVNREFRILNNS